VVVLLGLNSNGEVAGDLAISLDIFDGIWWDMRIQSHIDGNIIWIDII
jgi:hypothetical protein